MYTHTHAKAKVSSSLISSNSNVWCPAYTWLKQYIQKNHNALNTFKVISQFLSLLTDIKCSTCYFSNAKYSNNFHSLRISFHNILQSIQRVEAIKTQVPLKFTFKNTWWQLLTCINHMFAKESTNKTQLSPFPRQK